MPVLHREVPFARRAPHPIAKAIFIGAVTYLGYATWGVLAEDSRPHHITKKDIANLTVMKVVYEAYPSWALAHPDRLCPQSLTELAPYMGGTSLVDPWGDRYHFSCGPHVLPKGARGMWVTSAGADGVYGTSDDVRSDR